MSKDRNPWVLPSHCHKQSKQEEESYKSLFRMLVVIFLLGLALWGALIYALITSLILPYFGH